MSDVQSGSGSRLGFLLEGLVERVPHARSAVLLSSDGLPTAAHGLDRDSQDVLAAVASGLFSTSRAAGAKFAKSEHVGQVIVELDGAYLFISSAGDRSVLAVLAGQEVDVRVMGFETGQLVKSVQPFLATPARQPGTGLQGAAGQR